MADRTIEWAGSLTGLLGAWLLAINDLQWSGYGFVAFLVSNGFWIALGIRKRLFGLLLMQVGFTGSSLMGIARWLL
ncbi:MAG: hypothetical protein D6720_03030 [Gammaproteobacteria bacterium]|nr:MAG: hypothetical protein D6720_03030 [Gammaproteobacteria bacterium]